MPDSLTCYSLNKTEKSTVQYKYNIDAYSEQALNVSNRSKTPYWDMSL